VVIWAIARCPWRWKAPGAIFFNHGQVCTAGSRLLVHRSIYEAVTAGLAEAANGMVLGSGFDPAAQMGPLVSARQRERVDGFAGRHRAGRKAGGGRPCARGRGVLLPPHRVCGRHARHDHLPRGSVRPGADRHALRHRGEALALANDTSFGLGASVWTQKPATANRFAFGLKAGNVWINAHNILDPAVPLAGTACRAMGANWPMPDRAYTEAKSVTTGLY
jgi:phenylacetaldehyde dehydrogenase